ncbi:MAG: bifunctional [glutamate--ammonia ligase]-adenylyl-L-tyrosine phosphorylase/[glutamate--ammonia-ligase] adenylyltransferase [Sulfuriflexus sp.]|nr:bifunctional [glutamate--ammonia ligase]-adenylyl-L-tyrosine phosphorylase/[glutamate--ammonia-ligase] adenylyltransferase [Sulfuriflexus sp.]
MNQVSDNTLPVMPNIFSNESEAHWAAYLESVSEAELSAPSDPVICHLLQRLFVCSEFARQLCLHEPELFDELQQSGDLLRNYQYGEQLQFLEQRVLAVKDEAALMHELRNFRQREMLRIAFRDLSNWNDLDTTTTELTWLAEACIECALGVISGWKKKELGVPSNSQGEEQELVVIGMGKLGAHELNYSSDIDLIFVYSEEGETKDTKIKLENSEYFIRLSRQLIHVLNTATADGFVFRVDMRLRPFGDSGPLAISGDAFEEYYQTHGREWERYAMIKARIVAGDRDHGQNILACLRPFVYRRYIDFGVFESLREMKQLIERQVALKGMEKNIKLGAGGIREIEFIGQAFQLVHGGRREVLRQRPILSILDTLVDLELLPEFVVDELHDGYIFLRDCEHRLQMWRDEQTHDLPDDTLQQQRLAYSMGMSDWPSLELKLKEIRMRVDSHFQQVFAAPQAEQLEEKGQQKDLLSLWQGEFDDEQALNLLKTIGYNDSDDMLRRLGMLRESYTCRALSAKGRARMDALIPLLLGAAGGMPEADTALIRVLNLLEQIARRTAYLSLLVENPMALSQLVRLCAASPWISEHLASHPILLDELIDPRSLYALPNRSQRQAELDSRMQGIDEDDLEQQMDVLRQFQQASTLSVAAADVNADMPLMQVSSHLTEIAEVVLERVLDLAWQHMVKKHGRPPSIYDDKPCDPGFAILAYGKLGGIELGYGSDLDIVFLHAAVEGSMTDGEQAIDCNVFYARMAQRITHIMNTSTTAGILYEVDLRLRPSGASGMLVSSIQAFSDYQHEDAWIWEHQALVRARVVAGDKQLIGQFAWLRYKVLAQTREQQQLQQQVREMHAKMSKHLGSHKSGEFDVKHDSGGIVEIEFMVQYAVLQWAEKYPQLLEWTDNVRLLQKLVEVGLLDAQDGQDLADAYRAYRAEVHKLKLQERPARVSAELFTDERATVQRLWQAWLGSDNE